MTEARLLSLEKFHDSWTITNLPGAPISQTQTPQTPQSLLKLDYDRTRLLEFMTTTLTATPFAVAEHGWSGWFVDPSAPRCCYC